LHKLCSLEVLACALRVFTKKRHQLSQRVKVVFLLGFCSLELGLEQSTYYVASFASCWMTIGFEVAYWLKTINYCLHQRALNCSPINLGEERTCLHE
jgi:hypothetical protein